MTVSTIEKSISYIAGEKGEKSALLIDLSDKEVAIYFDELLETLDAENRLTEGGGRLFEEFKKEYLLKRG